MLRPFEGMQIDGFTLGARLHQGGFATIWAVTHALHRGAMIMKVPTILDGYDGPTIVGFEVEQMIMPRLAGPHVPRVVAVVSHPMRSERGTLLLSWWCSM